MAVDNSNSKINFFLSDPCQEADRRVSAKIKRVATKGIASMKINTDVIHTATDIPEWMSIQIIQ